MKDSIPPLHVGIATAILALLPIALEIIGVLYITLVEQQPRGPFLINRIYRGSDVGSNSDAQALDPILGHSHDFENLQTQHKLIPGFIVHGNVDDPDAYLVVTLGGSPTDGIIAEGNPQVGMDTWPKYLYERCRHFKQACTVLNGGIVSYSSNQEVLKTIRDVLPLKPDLIVSLNGPNEIDNIRNPHPMQSHYHKSLLRDIALSKVPFNEYYKFDKFLPNFSTLLRSLAKYRSPNNGITGVHLGTPYGLNAAQIWEKNIRSIRAIAQEFGISYAVFLQPVVGISDYTPTREISSQASKISDYLPRMRSFYKEARYICKTTNYCRDLSTVFDTSQDVYRDHRHPNRKGNAILAKHMASFLFKKEL